LALSANIFISFASQDLKVAKTLCSALESRGFSCWISSRDINPGENFQIAIVRAIRSAKVMLLVFTANSNSSDEMSKELALASQQKLIVVPLRVEDVAPNEAFAYEFATRQWIDFFADWEAAINQLCRRLAQAMPPDLPSEASADAPAVSASSAVEVTSPPAPIKVEAAPSKAEPAPAKVEAAPTPAAAAPKPVVVGSSVETAAPLKPASAAPASASVAAPALASASVAKVDPKPAATPAAKPEPRPAPTSAAAPKPASVGSVASASASPPARPAPGATPAAAAPARKAPMGLFIAIGAAVVLAIGAAVIFSGKKAPPRAVATQPAVVQPAVPAQSAPPAASTASAAPSAPAAPASAGVLASADTAAPGAALADESAAPSAPKKHVRKAHAASAAANKDLPY
jgi:hypothetical protein